MPLAQRRASWRYAGLPACSAATAHRACGATFAVVTCFPRLAWKAPATVPPARAPATPALPHQKVRHEVLPAKWLPRWQCLQEGQG